MCGQQEGKKWLPKLNFVPAHLPTLWWPQRKQRQQHERINLRQHKQPKGKEQCLVAPRHKWITVLQVCPRPGSLSHPHLQCPHAQTKGIRHKWRFFLNECKTRGRRWLNRVRASAKRQSLHREVYVAGPSVLYALNGPRVASWTSLGQPNRPSSLMIFSNFNHICYLLASVPMTSFHSFWSVWYVEPKVRIVQITTPSQAKPSPSA